MPEQRGYVPPDSESRPATVTTETSKQDPLIKIHNYLEGANSSDVDYSPLEQDPESPDFQDILEFYKTHGIPRESLSRMDTLFEAAKKLSTPDLQQLAILYDRFEHFRRSKT